MTTDLREHGKPPVCVLCRHDNTELFFKDTGRLYFQCPSCRLVFVPEEFHLTPSEEKAEYDLHRNQPDDPDYCRFLSRLVEPLSERLTPESHGLDLGCGPGPALSMLMEKKGHEMDLFDPFYHNDPDVFTTRYDFICASEVVEHFRFPEKEFSILSGLLKPGGWLGIMTKMVSDREAFKNWHYIRDFTHICFYSKPTFEYLAGYFSADLEFISNDVILLRKKE